MFLRLGGSAECKRRNELRDYEHVICLNQGFQDYDLDFRWGVVWSRAGGRSYRRNKVASWSSLVQEEVRV